MSVGEATSSSGNSGKMGERGGEGNGSIDEGKDNLDIAWDFSGVVKSMGGAGMLDSILLF